MKKFAAVVFLGVSLSSAFGQGLINFANGPSTLIGQEFNSGTGPGPISGAGNYYFALMTSPVGAHTFTFAGVYATNLTVAGLINGGSGIAVPGWAPGTARDFAVVGWYVTSGVTY